MEGPITSVKIGSLSESSFHTWKQKFILILALCEVDQYMEDKDTDDDNSRKECMHRDWKAGAVIGLSSSDEHPEPMRDVYSPKQM